MGLRLIYGRSGSGKSKFCFDEISKKLESEENIYMITPEQFSFTQERKLMNSIKQKSVINAEVITISRMADRLYEQLGKSKLTLSKRGKAMLVYVVLNKWKKDFKFLGKTDENIDLGVQILTEFKKHGISIEKLQKAISKTSDKYLQTKLKDTELLYTEFEKLLQSNYIEEIDKIDILSQNIDKLEWLKNSLIYIDEFSGFTYQEYMVIKGLVKVAKQVTMTICADELKITNSKDADIFYSNKITASNIKELLERENLKIEKPIFLNNSYRFKKPELKHLEENLYAKKSTKYAKNVENIHLFLAKNGYTEIENVARKITYLVREKKLRYRDISVITKNIDTYSNLIRAIFAKYDIPVFIDEKRLLSQNIIIQYILSIFEILVQNFTRESVFNYLKLGFQDIEEDDIYKLENYCIKWGIKQNKWKKDFKYELNDETKKNQIEYLNSLRKKIIDPLITLKIEMQKEKTAQNIALKLYEFLTANNFEEKLQIKINKLQETGHIDLANEYKEAHTILIENLDEIVEFFKNQTIDINGFYQLLKIGLKNSLLAKIPSTQDEVIVGDVERSRSHKVDVIFIIGINDGVFPSVNNDEGFFGDEERNKLKTQGIELANGRLENLYEENFNIYKAFTTSEKELYLSYSAQDTSGKALRPSVLINRIKKLFPNLQEESDCIRPKYEITNLKPTYEQILAKISENSNIEEMEKEWKQVYLYFQNNKYWENKLKTDLKTLNYTNMPKEISKEIIDKLYGNTLKTSISKLEKFMNCPFSYYLQYGLKLKEKEELKVQNFDTGSFMHEIIDQFFKTIKEENIKLQDLINEDQKIIEIVKKLVNENLENGRNYSFKETAKYKVLVKRLQRILSKALKYIIESLVYSEFNIEGTEIEFSEKGKYKPIIMNLENGKKIEIIGKIDRIDTAKSEEGKYLRIIDYKSSAKNIDLNEVYAGIQIQLLTYLDAVCKEEDLLPAGVLYFSLIEQIVKADKKITEEEIEEKIRANFKMKGLILADVKVIKMQDTNLKQGEVSKIIPAAITKTDTINNQKTNGIESEEFKILQNYITKTIKEIGKEILKGKIDIHPIISSGKKPCEYCSYKSICGFDTRLKGNKYRYIEKKTKDQVILDMKKSCEL